MKISKNTSMLVALILLSMGFVSEAIATRARTVNPVWYDLERELIEQGVPIDAANLMKIIEADDSPKALKWNAIEILGLREKDRAGGIINRLEEYIKKNNDTFLNETAAVALGRLGSRAGILTTKDYFLRQPDLSRKLYLAGRLAEFGDASAYAFVVDAAQDKNLKVRLACISALVEFIPLWGADHSVPSSTISPVVVLLEMLNEDNSDIRMQIVRSAPLMVQKGADKSLVKQRIMKAMNLEKNRELVEEMNAYLSSL